MGRAGRDDEEGNTEDAGPVKGHVVNVREMAEILGYAKGTVQRYLKLGMPVVRQGKAGRESELNTADCIAWVVAREKGASGSASAGFMNAREREKGAQATLKEYQVEEKRRTLIHVDAAAEAVETRFAVVKSRMNAMPARIAAKVHDPNVALVVERAAKDEVNQALSELSTPAVMREASERG